MLSRVCLVHLQSFTWGCPWKPTGIRVFSSVSSRYSTFPTFPATLLRYNSRRKSTLYDRRQRHERGDDPNWDGIDIPDGGLVQPGPSKDPTVYRGALLMPNTFTMQEIIRTEIDQYFDNEELGKLVDTPYIYSIKKGTPIPSQIVLLQEGLSRFSLQPSQPTSIEDLNALLDEFYAQFAERVTAEQWLNDHDFNSAVGDDAVATWMAR